MRRGSLYCLCIGAATSALLGVARGGGAWKAAALPEKRVTIDGRGYLTQPLSDNETTAVRRELEQLGVPLPDGFEIARTAETGHPVFRETLRPLAQQPVAAKLPPGFSAEHAIRLEADGQTVELVFGRTASPCRTVVARLPAEGWIPASQGETIPGPRLLHLTRRKETAVACLDEADRTFLLIRNLGM